MFSPLAVEVAIPFDVVEGDGVFPREVVVLFKAGKGKVSFAGGTDVVFLLYVLFNGLFFEVGLATVCQGRLGWNFICEWTFVFLALGLQKPESRDPNPVLFKVGLFSFWAFISAEDKGCEFIKFLFEPSAKLFHGICYFF